MSEYQSIAEFDRKGAPDCEDFWPIGDDHYSDHLTPVKDLE